MNSSLSKRFGARNTIHIYVGAIVAVFVASSLLLAYWLAFRSVSFERAQVEKAAHHSAKEISIAIAREIVSAQNILQALSSSYYLQKDDLEQFYNRAAEVAANLKIQLALRDAHSERIIFDTAFPWSSSQVQRVTPNIHDTIQQSLRSRKPAVSGVVFEPLLQRYSAEVLMPVTREATVAYFLCARLPLYNFAELLDQLQLDNEWIATITDRSGLIVARSEKHNEFVGKQVTVYPDALDSDAQSVSKGMNIEGVPFHWFSNRSELTDWRISVGIPDRVLAIAEKRAWISYVAASVALLAAAIALFYLLSRRLSRSFGALGVDRQPTREEFNVLFENAPNGVVVMDSQGLMVLLNKEVERMFGYSRDELVGCPVEVLVPQKDPVNGSELRSEYLGFSEATSLRVGLDLCGKHKDSSEFPIEIGLNPIETRTGNLTVITVVDISMRKQAEAELSAAIKEHDNLRRRLAQAQEQERLRLARELHDQTGQDLAAATLTLKGLEPFVIGSEQQRVLRLRGLLDQIGKTLQRVARELRPTAIDDLGLEIALANLVSDWSEQFSIDADLLCEADSLDGVSQEIKTTTYRVIQESLSNIAKHAGASSVSIVIDRTKSLLRLTIEDDGCGFDVATAGKRAREQFIGGLGIAGMHERVALLGGEIELESTPDAGTTIFVRIPIELERMSA